MNRNLNALKSYPHEASRREVAVDDFFVHERESRHETDGLHGFCEEDDTPPIAQEQRTLIDGFAALDRQERDSVMDLVRFLLQQHPP